MKEALEAQRLPMTVLQGSQGVDEPIKVHYRELGPHSEDVLLWHCIICLTHKVKWMMTPCSGRLSAVGSNCHPMVKSEYLHSLSQGIQ